MDVVRESVEHILAVLPDAIAFYNEDDLGAVVVYYDAGRACLIDVNEHGDTQSAWTEDLSTGWDA